MSTSTQTTVSRSDWNDFLVKLSLSAFWWHLTGFSRQNVWQLMITDDDIIFTNCILVQSLQNERLFISLDRFLSWPLAIWNKMIINIKIFLSLTCKIKMRWDCWYCWYQSLWWGIRGKLSLNIFYSSLLCFT